MAIDLLLEATINSIHDAMRSGQISCRQLLQLYLDRINAYDQQGPTLNSIQILNPSALQEAERLDARFKANGLTGPLHGIPVVVKDQVETSDMPTTYGSALFRGFVSGRDATLVERLRTAGAIILAKTNMGELAGGTCWGTAFGICRNPYDPQRSPGASSCGTGAAVAANLAAVGIGEDTLGSIRGPAAVNSLVGLRPTVPLVSRFGVMPEMPSRDTLGPMARTVRDAAILLDVLAGYDPNDAMTAASVGHIPATYTSFLKPDGLRDLRLGVIREPMSETVDPEAEDFRQVRAAIDRAVTAMAAAGSEIVDPVSVPALGDLLRRSNGANFEYETAINRYLAAHPHAPASTLQDIVLSADVLWARRVRLLQRVGRTTSDAGYLQQLRARDELRLAVLTVMADHRLDALVYASFDHQAPRIPADPFAPSASANDGSGGHNSMLSSMLGFPAISVPAGFTADGLPVGMQFLGRPFAEGVLFTIAYSFEQATLNRRPPKTTPALPGEP